jgi:hypothetical protein
VQAFVEHRDHCCGLGHTELARQFVDAPQRVGRYLQVHHPAIQPLGGCVQQIRQAEPIQRNVWCLACPLHDALSPSAGRPLSTTPPAASWSACHLSRCIMGTLDRINMQAYNLIASAAPSARSCATPAVEARRGVRRAGRARVAAGARRVDRPRARDNSHRRRLDPFGGRSNMACVRCEERAYQALMTHAGRANHD